MLNGLFGDTGEAQQPGNFFSRPNMLALGAGILSDNSPNAMGTGLATMGKFGLANVKTAQIENKTAEWLIRNGADRERVEAAKGIPGALSTMLKYALKPAQAQKPTSFSKTPVYGTDENGNTVLGTIGDDGSFKHIDTGDFNVASGFEKIDTGTDVIFRDKRSGQIMSVTPKNNYEEAFQKGQGGVEGKAAGEAQEAYKSQLSKLPGLYNVVSELDVLSDQATYTIAGQGRDAIARQIGVTTDGALARSQYEAMVNNQILPLLRDTFGAQFTEREGQTLRETLGDPNKSPAEKQAVLKAFIQQKVRNLQALASRTGQTGKIPPPPQIGGGNQGTTTTNVPFKVLSP